MTNSRYQNSAIFAEQMDSADPLKEFRDQFHLPKKKDGEPVIYLCGNSLGLQPVNTKSYIEEELYDWANLGVEGHFHAKHPWMPYHEFLAESSARVVGASPREVVVMNSLSVNLHLMMVSFYRPTKERYKILIEKNAFPSDIYAVASQLQYHGFDPADGLVEIEAADGSAVIETAEILETIDKHADSTALILMGGVNYYSGQAFDMKTITEYAHGKGISVGFDLAHAVGNLKLHLHDWNVDFACWCTYKYLNAGPGSVAGCFIHDRHVTNKNLPRFAGWWGHDKETRFKMGPVFNPIPSAEGWQLSNAPVLSMAALRASLDLFDRSGMDRLKDKSVMLTGFLDFLLRESQDQTGVEIITPAEPENRGCQLSLRMKQNGRQVFDKLTAEGVIGDWREPDVIRIAPVPLYNSYMDVWNFVQILKSFYD